MCTHTHIPGSMVRLTAGENIMLAASGTASMTPPIAQKASQNCSQSLSYRSGSMSTAFALRCRQMALLTLYVCVCLEMCVCECR
jgi:hypothetical protein